jgi:SAM-dependent methyltransferase
MLYLHDELTHNTKAAKEIVPQIIKLIQPNSVVDVGCGIGTWLAVFEELGVKDVVGIDGDYVNRNLLHIDEQNFIPSDLKKPFHLDRKFDLVVCLEVAEHLPEEAASAFIESLVSLSDIILFSAAIPDQGGQNHLNEQWPIYWQLKFKEHKFELHDFIRSDIWFNKNVDWWYKQNMLIAIKETSKISLNKNNILPIIHPELYSYKVMQLDAIDPTLKDLPPGEIPFNVALKIFLRALKKKIKNPSS